MTDLIAELNKLEGIRCAIGGTPEIGEHYRKECAAFCMLNHAELIAALSLPRQSEADGTFDCPICGINEPHQHTGEEIARHRGAIDRGDPISFYAYGQAFQDAVRGGIEFRFSPQMIDAIKTRASEIQCRINRAPQPAQADTTPAAHGVGELRLVAKRNLRSMIECGSDDKALMLKCLEELS